MSTKREINSWCSKRNGLLQALDQLERMPEPVSHRGNSPAKVVRRISVPAYQLYRTPSQIGKKKKIIIIINSHEIIIFLNKEI